MVMLHPSCCLQPSYRGTALEETHERLDRHVSEAAPALPHLEWPDGAASREQAGTHSSNTAGLTGTIVEQLGCTSWSLIPASPLTPDLLCHVRYPRASRRATPSIAPACLPSCHPGWPGCGTASPARMHAYSPSTPLGPPGLPENGGPMLCCLAQTIALVPFFVVMSFLCHAPHPHLQVGAQLASLLLLLLPCIEVHCAHSGNICMSHSTSSFRCSSTAMANRCIGAQRIWYSTYFKKLYFFT